MYLKPTQQLWNQIEQKIDTMFKERIVYAANWYNYGLNKTQFDKLCMAAIVPPEEDALVQQLGSKWLARNDDITARIYDGNEWQSYTFPATIGGRKNFVSPLWSTYSSQAKPQVDNETIKSIATQRREAIRKVTAEQNEFKESVKKVWNDAPSVNSIAKIWPPIIDLLPSSVVQKLEQKSTRRTTKQLAEDVDTKALSVHILKAKVAQ